MTCALTGPAPAVSRCCATVCPSGALFYAPREEVERLRTRSRPINQFQFGDQRVTTKVQIMVPKASPVDHLDVTAAMDAPPTGSPILLNILTEIPREAADS